jgi:hypothetical protein
MLLPPSFLCGPPNLFDHFTPTLNNIADEPASATGASQFGAWPDLSATTSEFLTCNITYASGSPTFDGSITAVRLP